MRNLDELCDCFSGLVFLIGSGPSLHFEDLDFLNQHFTIAVNAGYLRHPTSDAFISDDEDFFFWSYIDDLRKSSTTSVLLYEDKIRKFGNLEECQSLFGDRLVLFNHRKGYDFPGSYKHSIPQFGIPQARCSLITSAYIAYLLGFRKIILLGADCVCIEGKRYFYDFPGWEKPTRKKPFVQRRLNRKIGDHHTHQDLIEILHGWDIVAKNMKNLCEIFNASKISIISSFPKIDLEEFRRTKNNQFSP